MAELFSGLVVGTRKVKNRIVLPPLVIRFGIPLGKAVTEQHLAFYERIAMGGTGTIITGAAAIDDDGMLKNGQLSLADDMYIPGFTRLTERIRKYGALALAQINHAGLQSRAPVSGLPCAPSGYSDADIRAREMSETDMTRIQDDFVSAAIRAKKAGFDGIEIHGAHGYLLSQFMSPIINHRTDQYGGSFENRCRYPFAVLNAIRVGVGPEYIISYRMGANDTSLAEACAFAILLEQHGVNIIHVSHGFTKDFSFAPSPADFPFSPLVYAASVIRHSVRIPVIAVGNIETPDQADQIIKNEFADFVAVGRGHLVQPEWTFCAQNGIEIRRCRHCTRCLFLTDGKRCPARKIHVSEE